MTKGQSERSSACAKCGKTFARSDTLLRHEKSHLATEVRGPVHRVTHGTFRACDSCAQARSRCSGGSPCGRCKVRNLNCTYPNKRRRTTSAVDGSGAPQTIAEGSNGISKIPSERQLSFQQYTPGPGGSVFSYAPIPSRDNVLQDQPSTKPIMQASVMTASDTLSSPSVGNTAQSTSAVSRRNLIPTDHATIDDFVIADLPETSETSNGQTAYQNMMHYDLNHSFPETAGDYPFADSYDDQINLNWIPLSIIPSPYGDIDQDFSFLLPSIPENVGFEHSFDLMMPDSGNTFIPNHDTSGSFAAVMMPSSALNASVAALIQSPSSSISDSAAIRSVSGEGTSIQHKSKKRKHSQIADMFAPNRPGRKEYGFPDTFTPVTDNSRELCSDASFSLIHGAFVRLCCEGCSQSQFSNSTFPERLIINRCIDLYFDVFNPTFPLLHQASAHPENMEWILLLAMAAVGSNFLPVSSCIDLRAAFHELLRRAVDDLTNSESQNFRNLSIAQARVLNLVCMMQSDSNRSRLLVPRYHAELSRWCLESGILKITGPDEICPQNIPSQSKVSVWHRWIRQESERRTGYLIWLLDCAVGYMSNSRPLCNMDDARAPLPCTEALWEAKDADEWSQLAVKSSTAQSLPVALEDMYSMKKVDSRTSEISNILLVHALFSRTWEVGTHIRQPLSEWKATGDKRGFLKTPSKDDFWLPLYPLYANWRNSACDCLDTLHWHALGVVLRASGSEHHTVLHLHLARIILLTPFQEIQDLLFYLINQNVGEDYRATFYVHDGSYQRRTPAKLAQTRKITYRWLREDQHKARLAVVHAGSVFWHVRRYSSNSFFEPIAIYLASIVLWTYGSYKSAALEREAADRQIGSDVEVQPTRVELAAAQSHSPQTQPLNKADSPAIHNSARRPEVPPVISPSATSPDQQASPSQSPFLSSEDEEDQPEFIHLDRPCDDEIVQHFVRNGHNMAGYMSHVGDICQTPAKVLLEGAKLLRSKLAAWGASRDYHDVLMRLAAEKATGAGAGAAAIEPSGGETSSVNDKAKAGGE